MFDPYSRAWSNPNSTSAAEPISGPLEAVTLSRRSSTNPSGERLSGLVGPLTRMGSTDSLVSAATDESYGPAESEMALGDRPPGSEIRGGAQTPSYISFEEYQVVLQDREYFRCLLRLSQKEIGGLKARLTMVPVTTDSQSVTREEYDALLDARKALDRMYLRSKQEVSTLRGEVSKLTSALTTARNLDAAREVLRADGGSISDTDNLDPRYLVDTLSDINLAMKRFANQFTQTIRETVKATKPTRTQLSALLQTYSLSGMIQPWHHLIRKKGRHMEQIIGLVVQHALCAEMMERVFSTFAPGTSFKDDAPWWHVYGRVSEREPQERWAQWRALTYAHARPDKDTDHKWCSHVETKFLVSLVHSLAHILPPDTLSSEAVGINLLKNSIDIKVSQLLLEAIKVQDMMKAQYMSYDYEPFMAEVDTPFDHTTMETTGVVSSGGKGIGVGIGKGKESVALAVGLGLRARRNISLGDRIKRDKKILIKSFVVCYNGLPGS